MRGDNVRWLSAAALSLVILASGGMGSGRQVVGFALAAEPAQVPTRSLTPEEIRGLQQGEDMGLARVAEFNGYPGPAHILEAARAGKIDMYADQRQAIERIQAATKAKAESLGRQILAQEALLESGFRTGRIAEEVLAHQVEDIGRKLPELRLTYLRAHLQTISLLRPEQIEEYYQFRGYTASSPGYHLGY
jgi:hypothetical protein